ncbi:threonine/serine exporter [Mesobacillus boroniphilus]|uniref:Threonine/serine exporter n=1 Tax=Mesobacillus boroniphilus TaxID=308892 RepID=A0A944GYA9_9BACI|nr:threonine/serine exporter family protein [Mesobacillus boroniphilus]MBS8266782.1 threonine/serine exporter [Mesobacillus boroniphilus]
MENQDQTFEVMRACMLAGKIMLQSGAETYRVEDTMSRMASAFGIDKTHSYVTPTGIIFSVEGVGPERTKLVRISERTTDLRKVAMVNSISRNISSGEVGLAEACKLLMEIEQANLTYSFPVQITAAAIASGCFTIMFQGSWLDFLPSMAAGGIGFFLVVYFHKIVPVKFFAEFLSSFFIGMLSFFFVKFGLGQELDKIIIGSVMPLVPGLLITNAVRDLMAGHLVSGLSKGAEALLTAFAIGSGIAAILSFL